MEDIFKCNSSSEDDENKDWELLKKDWQLSLMQSLSPINIQAGTSNDVVLNLTNVSTVQVPQSPTLSRDYSFSWESERAMRKRIADQEYRRRSKNKKEEMQHRLWVLTEENESLKKENASLTEDNALMNQTLRDQANENHRLRSDLSQLKRENENQKVLMETVSEHLAIPAQLEIEMLKEENAALRKNANLTHTQLAEETAKLGTENKVLKVQIDALCGKIISGNEKKHEQGTLN